jgi:hypothetical protein
VGAVEPSLRTTVATTLAALERRGRHRDVVRDVAGLVFDALLAT